VKQRSTPILVIAISLLAATMTSCGKDQGQDGPAEPSMLPAAPTTSGKVAIEVVNSDFEGQSAVEFILHEKFAVRIFKVIINGHDDGSCVFDKGAVLAHSDGTPLPSVISPGEHQRTPFFPPTICGEPTRVTILTDHGIGDYPVADPNFNAMKNSTTAPLSTNGAQPN
jgi:hypothetical protein